MEVDWVVERVEVDLRGWKLSGWKLRGWKLSGLKWRGLRLSE